MSGAAAHVADGEPTKQRQWWIAGRVLALVVLVAIPVLRASNREQWFFLDEWDYLAGRSLSDPGDLFRSHNGHWSTIPILIYRALFAVVGLHHYWPYQSVVITVHLALAVLVWTIMRRVGADPWIATTLSVLFVFFGSGRANIGWAFQIGFAGSVALGLGQLLVSDHRGPVGRRDVLAVVLGAAAIMTHGPAVAVVAGTGAALWLRRGWRAAAVQVVPLGLLFIVWAWAERPLAGGSSRSLGQVLRFAVEMFVATFSAIGQHRVVTVLLVALVIVGIVLAAIRTGLEPGDARTLCVGPTVAALVFAVLTALGRAGEAYSDGPDASRYVHLMAALLLPLVAVGVSEVVKGRARAWTVVAAGLVLAGLPGNYAALWPSGIERFTLGRPAHWSELAELADTGRYPAGHRPETFEAPDVTVAWLETLVDEGRIAGREGSTTDRLNAELALLLTDQRPIPGTACQLLEFGDALVLDRNSAVVIESDRATVERLDRGRPSGSRLFADFDGDPMVVRTVVDAVRLRVTVPDPADSTARVCRS